MSATNAFETALLTLYFNNTDHANIGDAAGLQNSATAGSFYVSLHTGDPGEGGDQTTSEATYTGCGAFRCWLDGLRQQREQRGGDHVPGRQCRL
jgi:hypothetical protein